MLVDMKSPLINRQDEAHKILLPFLADTEILFNRALKTIDKKASGRILPAVDLGFPHDVIRLAGGFPTGCYVEWECSQPFVPIDTTVNIDTSSIFILDNDISDVVTADTFIKLQSNIEDSSYIFNFHKGNHFISFGSFKGSGIPVLVLHSNEKEFKYQFNGLMPSEDNWYAEDVKVVEEGQRYLRFITGDTARLFVDIAKSLEDFNIIRHRFIAHLLTRDKTKIISQEDHHHYFMPTRESVAIGCFPVPIGTEVPIFSRLGRDISIFEPYKGGKNVIRKLEDGTDLVLVPHGWGKTCHPNTKFSIDFNSRSFNLSGKLYEIKTLVSLGKDTRLELRNFESDDKDGTDNLFSLMQHHCPGKLISTIKQLVSFTKNGFVRHE